MHPARFSRWAAWPCGSQIRIDCGRAVRVPRRRTSRGCASTWIGTGSHRRRQGRSVLSGMSVIGRRSRGSGPIEESQHMPLGAGVPSLRLVVDRGGLLAVHRNCCRSLGRWRRTMCLGCWRSYGFIRPVLKHGPRSLPCARVFGWLKPTGAMKVKAASVAEVRTCLTGQAHHRPTYSTLRKVWVRAHLLGPERWWTMPE